MKPTARSYRIRNLDGHNCLFMRVFLKQHSLLILYFLSLLLVSAGLYYGFGAKHLPKVIFYTVSFVISYFLFHRLFRDRNFKLDKFTLKRPSKNIVDLSLFLFCSGFVIIHMIFLGHVPFITAYNTLDYYYIALIRQHIGEHDNNLIHYLSSFMIRGFIPFAVLYFSVSNKKLFYLFIPFAIFYAIALMQKSLIVTVMTPTAIYAFCSRKYFKSLLMVLTSVFGVFILVYTTNPSLRATQEEIRLAMLKSGKHYEMEAERGTGEGILVASDAIYTRVFLTTGLVSGHWFEKIPSKFPYARGCGYHFLAPMLGCNFTDYDYSRIIYDDTYKKEAKMGMKGTVTVASFVYDYANFGYYGLCYSGIILAFFFTLLNKIFANNIKWNLSLNFLYIFWLSSAAFTTILLSGGWILTLLLFFFYKPYIKEFSHS